MRCIYDLASEPNDVNKSRISLATRTPLSGVPCTWIIHLITTQLRTARVRTRGCFPGESRDPVTRTPDENPGRVFSGEKFPHGRRLPSRSVVKSDRKLSGIIRDLYLFISAPSSGWFFGAQAKGRGNNVPETRLSNTGIRWIVWCGASWGLQAGNITRRDFLWLGIVSNLLTWGSAD